MTKRVSILVLVAVALLTPACNRRVFQQVETTCDTTLAGDFDVKADKAADILIVVDNSGSMQDEQTNLVNNFLNGNINECPIPVASLGDFGKCDDAAPPAICQYANPPPEDLLPPDGRLANCGFIQVLAAYENDFRIGVITTDVGACDNRCPGLGQGADFCLNSTAPECNVCAIDGGAYCENQGTVPDVVNCGDVSGGWGFHPQRGCLQPSYLPPRERVIARADLVDDDDTNNDLGARFSLTLNSIRTFGTSVERGLDAAKLFLDPTTDRGEGCANDLDNFLRPEAKLVMIFLSDEQDCSHGNSSFFACRESGGCVPGFEEFYGDTCGIDIRPVGLSAAPCYDRIGELTPVTQYAEYFRSVKADPTDVSVAVIAGGAIVDDRFQPADCRPSAAGLPEVGCRASRGQSNSAECIEEGDCCLADNGSRYYDLVDELGGIKDSICFNSFRQTMTRIASFIGAVDKVTLAEEPESPFLVVVEKATASDRENFVTVPRIAGNSCGEENGWVLEADNVSVRFCGTERPGPGDRVRVRAKGAVTDDENTPNQSRCIVADD
jgi:hypothetical protein